MQEVWKVWKETSRSLWEVSDQGQVKRNGELYECRLCKGYKMFGYWLVHRAVTELFIPNPKNKPCVDHINTNKLDNRICNLRWCTYKENMNNPITRKYQSETHKKEETRRKISEARKRYWKNKKEQK